MKVLTLIIGLLTATCGQALTLKEAIRAEASVYAVPKELLSAICWVESTHNYRSIAYADGNTPSYGLCQVKLSTAKLMGYKGDAKGLLEPIINIRYAAKYLKHQLKRYRYNYMYATAAYNSGTLRLRNGTPTNWRYVQKVYQALVEGR